jgi:C-terminal processing protease CtpA/Prc
LSKDGARLFVRNGSGQLLKVDVRGLDGEEAPDEAQAEPIPFRAEMRVNGPAERAYVYWHAVRQVARKFYREDLHGVDWPALGAYYAGFLSDVTDNSNFAELLSELLGELNASHTGARHRPVRDPSADTTASLGLLFDTQFQGEGLRVAEVLVGGPADKATSRIATGVVVTHVDGTALGQGNPWPAFDRRDGRPVLVGLRDAQGVIWEERILPIKDAETGELLYRRWLRRCREIVHARSKGRVGYVHVRGMDDGSFREVFDVALGRESDREALVVDTRWNGGGWLHDDLVKFLDGHVYGAFEPRGKEPGALGTEPLQRWSRPVAVVQGEGNYSDAHIFPYAFQRLGLGKLVGAPVAGTGTAVWWERQIDPTLVFGIPQVGIRTPEGVYLENLDLVPDELVLNTPEDVAAGLDRQLERAVDVLLEELTK